MVHSRFVSSANPLQTVFLWSSAERRVCGASASVLLDGWRPRVCRRVWASLLEWNLHRLECCQQSVLLTQSDSRHHVTPPSYSVSGSRCYISESKSESEQPYLSPCSPQDSGRATPLVDRRYWTKEGRQTQQTLKKATLPRIYRRDIFIPDSFKFSVHSKMSVWFMNDFVEVV